MPHLNTDVCCCLVQIHQLLNIEKELEEGVRLCFVYVITFRTLLVFHVVHRSIQYYGRKLSNNWYIFMHCIYYENVHLVNLHRSVNWIHV